MATPLLLSILCSVTSSPSAIADGPRLLTLSDAVAIAFKNRDSVRSAEAKVRSSEANRSALGAFLPSRLEIGGGTTPDVGIGTDLLLAQPIDLFGKTRASRASGQAGVDSARASMAQTKLDLQTEVLNAFAESLAAQRLIETGSDLAAIAEKAYNATKKRIDVGDLPPVELLRADLEVQRAKQTLALRNHSLQAARLRLAASLGISVAILGELAETLPRAPSMPSLDERPDIAQIKSELNSAKADARSASLSSWPDVELQFGRSPFDQPEQYNARVQFVLPLYDFGAAREKRRSAMEAQRAAQRSLEDRRATARKEVQAAKSDLDAATEEAGGFDALEATAKQLLDKEQRGFSAGAATLLDVLEATRSLREIEETAVEAKTRQIQAQAKYLSATGALLSDTQ